MRVRYLKAGNFAKRTAGGAAIYMAAVLEYLTAEVTLRRRIH